MVQRAIAYCTPKDEKKNISEMHLQTSSYLLPSTKYEIWLLSRPQRPTITSDSPSPKVGAIGQRRRTVHRTPLWFYSSSPLLFFFRPKVAIQSKWQLLWGGQRCVYCSTSPVSPDLKMSHATWGIRRRSRAGKRHNRVNKREYLFPCTAGHSCTGFVILRATS